jgi:hypothetical protein
MNSITEKNNRELNLLILQLEFFMFWNRGDVWEDALEQGMIRRMMGGMLLNVKRCHAGKCPTEILQAQSAPQ